MKYAGADRQNRSAFAKVDDIQASMAHNEKRAKRPRKKKKKSFSFGGLLGGAMSKLASRDKQIAQQVRRQLNR